MKATGIIRRIDELGRIVIPKEIRRQLGLRESTPMELFVEGNSVLFKKYVPEENLIDRIKDFEDAFVDLKFEMDREQAAQIEEHIIALRGLLNTQ